MALFDLKGRVAFITGASSGLGKQFAWALARQGAEVAIVARRLDKLEEVAKEMEAEGYCCLPVQCDLTLESDVVKAVQQVIDHFGKIDILVNNAGLAIGGKAEDMNLEDFERVLKVNISGVFLCAREVGKHMIANRYGRIINIGSAYGAVGNKFSPTLCYHTSKGAIINFSRALATEWAKYDITVNNIAPGYYETEMTENLFRLESFLNFVKAKTVFERPGRVDELDTAVVFLAANESSYITGQTIYVDGGWTSI